MVLQAPTLQLAQGGALRPLVSVAPLRGGFYGERAPLRDAWGNALLFWSDGRRYLLDDSIVALAARLKPWGFLRVHRAELINLHQVKSLRRVDDSTIVELADGQRALVSRRQVQPLKRALGVR